MVPGRRYLSKCSFLGNQLTLRDCCFLHASLHLEFYPICFVKRHLRAVHSKGHFLTVSGSCRHVSEGAQIREQSAARFKAISEAYQTLNNGTCAGLFPWYPFWTNSTFMCQYKQAVEQCPSSPAA